MIHTPDKMETKWKQKYADQNPISKPKKIGAPDWAFNFDPRIDHKGEIRGSLAALARKLTMRGSK
jgi:hypothetical protein